MSNPRWEWARDWQELQDEVGAWSDSVWGFRRPPDDPLGKLKEEVDELLDGGQYDPEEYADVLLCLIDAARMANFDMDALFYWCNTKMRRNLDAQWEDDGTGNKRRVK